MKLTSVTGSINFACGRRISYDDTNDEHRANRLAVTRVTPAVTCPDHGLEEARCAVIGPARLLWPDPAVRAEVMWDLHLSSDD